jgi:microcystin-dependent protein
MTRDPPAEHNHSKTGTGGGEINPKKLRGADIENANADDVPTFDGNGGMEMRARKGIPPGGIIMWSGTTTNIPSGWTLCDGTNPDGPDSEVPDLRDRFIAGAGNQYSPDDTGGSDEVTLTESELPSHDHTMDTAGAHTHGWTDGQPGDLTSNNVDGGTGNNASNGTTDMQSAGDHTHNINNAGSDQAHENRPQYHALAFIMRL